MSNNYLNLSTDPTLGGESPSDSTPVSQKAINDYIEGKSDVVAAAIAGLEARLAALEQRLSPEGNLGKVNVDDLSVIKTFNNYTAE